MYGLDSDRIKRRIKSIYELDTQRPLRMSYKNPYIQALYDDFLEKPGSHKAHELLHTSYSARRKKGKKES